MKDWSFEFRILVKKEDDLWVAHCLELDLVAAAPTEEQVESDIIDIIREQIIYCVSNDNMDHLFRRAPEEIWEEYLSCAMLMKPKSQVIKAPPRKSIEEDLPSISFTTSACTFPLSVCHA
ncbi:MAG: hypothetical protein V1792_19175 [Pseudomonadota bacterium]